MGLTIVSPIFLVSLFFDFDWRRISLYSGKEGNAHRFALQRVRQACFQTAIGF